MLFNHKKKQAPEIPRGLVLDYMLDSFKIAENPVMILPWEEERTGSHVYCVLKRLTHIEIKSCGDFSLIQTERDKINQREQEADSSWHDASKFLTVQHDIAKLAMVSPTFEQVEAEAFKYKGVDKADVDNQLREIQSLFNQAIKSGKSSDIKESIELKEKYARLEVEYKLILPNDFLVYVMNYALSKDISQINLVNEDILHLAYLSAHRANNAPINHVHGIFTDFNQEDINLRAWQIGDRKEREKKELTPKY